MKADDFYFVRLLVIFLLVFTLGYSIINATESKAIFTSMILFLLPMVLDYYSQTPLEEVNQKRKQKALALSSVMTTLSLGCWICFDFKIKSGISSYLDLWKIGVSGIFLLFVVIAIYEWIGYTSPEELRNRKRMKKAVEDINKKKDKSKSKAAPNVSAESYVNKS